MELPARGWFLAIAVIAWVTGDSREMVLTTLIVGFALCLEQLSDIYHGAMQRRDRMDFGHVASLDRQART